MSALLEALNHLAALWIADGEAGAVREIRLDEEGMRLTLALDNPWAKGELELRARTEEAAGGLLRIHLKIVRTPAVLQREAAPFRELFERGQLVVEIPPRNPPGKEQRA